MNVPNHEILGAPYLALIDRAGDLYRRILACTDQQSEVCTHDWGQDSPIHTHLAVIIGQKQEQFNLFNVTGLH